MGENVMVKEIKRDYYLEQLINREGNGLIKIVIGKSWSWVKPRIRNCMVDAETNGRIVWSKTGNIKWAYR